MQTISFSVPAYRCRLDLPAGAWSVLLGVEANDLGADAVIRCEDLGELRCVSGPCRLGVESLPQLAADAYAAEVAGFALLSRFAATVAGTYAAVLQFQGCPQGCQQPLHFVTHLLVRDGLLLQVLGFSTPDRYTQFDEQVRVALASLRWELTAAAVAAPPTSPPVAAAPIAPSVEPPPPARPVEDLSSPEERQQSDRLLAEAHRECVRKPPNLAGAMARAEKALEIWPCNAWAHILLGEICERQRSWELALAHYNRVRECNPNPKADMKARERAVVVKGKVPKSKA